MVAQITAFRSRRDLRLKPPKRRSTNITPEKGGCAVHWGGPAPRNHTHALCEQTWRFYQNYHMRPGGLGAKDGANDVAYTAAFCNHGYVMAGRGFGTRTGAQGSNFGNQNFYAFVWIGGAGQKPNQLALDALDWLINEARTKHRAGRAVSPHHRFNRTTCPGPDLTRAAAARNNRDIPLPGKDDPKPKPDPDDKDEEVALTKRIQRDLQARGLYTGNIDGDWGPLTEAAYQALLVLMPEKNPYAGKKLVSKVDGLRFYDSPRWTDATGTFDAGYSFPVVEGMTTTGSGSWYRVRNSNGDGPFYVTTREDLAQLVD